MKVHKIECDRCGSRADLKEKPKTSFSKAPSGILGNRKSRKSGLIFKKPSEWKRVDGKDLCPSCSEEIENFFEADPDG